MEKIISLMASSTSNPMEVDRQDGGETDWYQLNEENITSNAVHLQTRLSKLKLEIIQAMARNKVEKTNNPVVELADDGELFGEEATRVTDQLHQITKERTQTFLNFSSLNAAKKAAQSNQAIMKALNLESGGKIDLEKEEEYLRSLLDDQKELIKEVVEQHKEGVNQDMEIIETRIKLAELYSRYSRLTGRVVEIRKAGSQESWEKETARQHDELQRGDRRLNQMRFMIQKLMISFDKFGLQFEDQGLNDRYRALLVRCGKSPEELRNILLSEDSPDTAGLAPAAAADLEK